jgi:hypothetical protein
MALIFFCMLISGSIAVPDMLDQSIGGNSQNYQTISSNKGIDSNAFIDAGCFVDGYNLDCSNSGLNQRFGCIWMSTPLQHLATSLPRFLWSNASPEAKTTNSIPPRESFERAA